MCGRFTLRTPPRDIAELFRLVDVPELHPRYNIAPTQPVAAVRQIGQDRELSLFQWGLIPSWAKDPRMGAQLINARAESIATKPSFRSAFRRRRCLIFADGFYEWQKTRAKTKQPFYIRLANDRLFAFAGLWEHWEGADSAAIESCTIITTDANDLLRPLHDRMPVILPEQEYGRWLDPQLDDPVKLQALLKPYPAEQMTAYPVSTFVNSPRSESPRCIEAQDQGGITPR